MARPAIAGLMMRDRLRRPAPGRRLLFAWALLLGTVGSPALAATLEAVLLRPIGTERQRLVLEFDSETEFRLREDAGSLAIEVSAAPGPFLVLPPAGGLVRELVIEDLGPDRLRLRAGLAPRAEVGRSFSQPPDASGGYRLVIDLAAPDAPPAGAGPDAARPAQWWMSGSLSGRAEYYGNDGDPNSGIYFSEGEQHYGEFNLNLERQASAFERLLFRTTGLYNRSDYRSPEQDAVLEQLALRWVKGDTAVPFSLQLGDYFGYLSRRSLQLALKGAQLELQPGGTGGWRHSLLVFGGEPAPTYDQLVDQSNRFSGASWLASDSDLGLFSLNYVHNRDASRLNPDGSDRVQDLFSLTGLSEFRAAGQRLTLEAEVARADGDGADFQDQQGLGYFAQLSGYSDRRPFSYSARVEQYDEHYAPAGALVTRDRRSLETRLNWQFEAGPRLRLRALGTRDAYASDNPADTLTYGASLVGPLNLVDGRRLTLDADLFTQAVSDATGSADTRTDSARLDLSAPLSGPWSGRFGLFHQDVDDRIDDAATAATRQLRLVVSRDLQWGGAYGFVAPELVLRTIDRPASSSDETGPGLTFGLYGAAYALDGWYLHLDQARSGTGVSDFTTDSFGLLFSTWWGSHFLEVEANYDRFGPDPGEDTSGYRLGVQYTWFFEHHARPAVPAVKASSAGLSASAARPAGRDALLAVAPGQSLTAAVEALAALGLALDAGRPQVQVFDGPGLVPELDRQQQYAVQHDGRRVVRTALSIEFEPFAGPPAQARDYADLRALLVRRFGPPMQVQETGEFTDTLDADLAAGRFIRLIEWQTDVGRLRFGIPRRLDGVVRMELGLAGQYPHSARSSWSLGGLR